MAGLKEAPKPSLDKIICEQFTEQMNAMVAQYNAQMRELLDSQHQQLDVVAQDRGEGV